MDLRGQPCPEPLVKAVRVLARLPPGGRVVFLTDNEECADNIAYVARSSGIGPVSVKRKNGYYEISISRAVVI